MKRSEHLRNLVYLLVFLAAILLLPFQVSVYHRSFVMFTMMYVVLALSWNIISGYTGYLNESELAHAEGTLTDLLQVLIDKPGPPLIISKLEGDAVFSYAFEGDAVSGQTFVELVEDTYVEFRKTVDLMVLNNSCQCNACANVSSLDLKFVIHHGEFLIQKVGKFEEL
ncbi:MAG: DUF2652 domain-containing protein, partial [SAR324 cluster bacterium]|nr:DUF2652 domain-containing protein [SAR324 cluster bacterium]